MSPDRRGRDDTAKALIGLVLAGGQSTRMGVDKASLLYQGTTLLDRSVNLVKPFCDRVLVAVNDSQRGDPLRKAFDLVVDPPGDVGPAGALLSAWDGYPGNALLVVACDMPRLQASTISQLLDGRGERSDATAFAGLDGRPEPMCALWEFRCYPALALAISAGRRSPRAFLENEAKLTLLDAPHPEWLQSVNRPQDLENG